MMMGDAGWATGCPACIASPELSNAIREMMDLARNFIPPPHRQDV
jgi:hypothetical protein